MPLFMSQLPLNQLLVATAFSRPTHTQKAQLLTFTSFNPSPPCTHNDFECTIYKHTIEILLETLEEKKRYKFDAPYYVTAQTEMRTACCHIIINFSFWKTESFLSLILTSTLACTLLTVICSPNVSMKPGPCS